MVTSVGIIIRNTFGMNRAKNSIRAWIDRRPRMGPMTNPTKRSIPVQSPPPTTWKKSSAQSQLPAMATTRKPRTTPTIGMPATGTICTAGRTDGEVDPRPSAGPALDLVQAEGKETLDGVLTLGRSRVPSFRPLAELHACLLGAQVQS